MAATRPRIDVADPTFPPRQTVHATAPGLYRHFKGGWYEVIDTVRCSETLQDMTLYRALYGADLAAGGLWVRPAAMFNEMGNFGGKMQPRFTHHDAAKLPLFDLPTAHALVAHLRGRFERQRGMSLDSALRPPPPEPTDCCGRGCNGCVWEGFYTALQQWRSEALALLRPGMPAAAID